MKEFKCEEIIEESEDEEDDDETLIEEEEEVRAENYMIVQQIEVEVEKEELES